MQMDPFLGGYLEGPGGGGSNIGTQIEPGKWKHGHFSPAVQLLWFDLDLYPRCLGPGGAELRHVEARGLGPARGSLAARGRAAGGLRAGGEVHSPLNDSPEEGGKRPRAGPCLQLVELFFCFNLFPPSNKMYLFSLEVG